MNVQYIGIDEAGRGPLAGPVVVAGIKIKRGRQGIKNLFRGIRDSKKLTKKQREEWFLRLTCHPGVTWAVARVGPCVIDRINIARAANLGAKRVCQKLLTIEAKPQYYRGLASIVLDGSLTLPKNIPHRTIIKGDEKIPIISAASIIAKVTRDRMMLRLHRKFPEYCFDIHKGYGTKLHRKLIRKHGRSEAHRKSFHF